MTNWIKKPRVKSIVYIVIPIAIAVGLLVSVIAENYRTNFEVTQHDNEIFDTYRYHNELLVRLVDSGGELIDNEQSDIILSTLATEARYGKLTSIALFRTDGTAILSIGPRSTSNGPPKPFTTSIYVDRPASTSHCSISNVESSDGNGHSSDPARVRSEIQNAATGTTSMSVEKIGGAHGANKSDAEHFRCGIIVAPVLKNQIIVGVMKSIVSLSHTDSPVSWHARELIPLQLQVAAGLIVMLTIWLLYNQSQLKAETSRTKELARAEGGIPKLRRSQTIQQVEQRIAKAKQNNRLVAVIMLDINNFRNINEHLGTYLGDEFLKLIFDRLKNNLRSGDLVQHLSADKFFIVSELISDTAAATIVCRHLLQCFDSNFKIDGKHIQCSARVGVAIGPTDGENFEKLYQAAEFAIKTQSLATTEGFSFFNKEKKRENTQAQQLEEDLSWAVKHDELELAYQPLVDAETNILQGFEALVRWNHPRLGSVSPARFIPLAERSGFIQEIGDWVLKTACADAAAWPFDAYVSVNLSLQQFYTSRNLAGTIASMLVKNNLPNHKLHLEITESVINNPKYDIFPTLCRIRDMGVSISIDDFGTGYSSLSALHSIPFSTLKIDQSFVRDIEKSSEQYSTVELIINLGHTYGAKVIAEGVEELGQAKLLAELKCDLLQGYYFSKPLPLREIYQKYAHCHDAPIQPAEVAVASHQAGTGNHDISDDNSRAKSSVTDTSDQNSAPIIPKLAT